ncbi:hypothetical protein ACVWXU_007788 [Streptomyces sp. TE33382]
MSPAAVGQRPQSPASAGAVSESAVRRSRPAQVSNAKPRAPRTRIRRASPRPDGRVRREPGRRRGSRRCSRGPSNTSPPARGSRVRPAARERGRAGSVPSAPSPPASSTPRRGPGGDRSPSPQVTRWRTADPFRSFTTSSWAGIRRRRSATWLTMPTLRSRSRSESSTSSTSSRVWSSRLPKPSSMKSVSSPAPPASSVTTSARPSARASEAKNVSPPESVAVSRSRPVQASTTCRPSPDRRPPARASEWTRV